MTTKRHTRRCFNRAIFLLAAAAAFVIGTEPAQAQGKGQVKGPGPFQNSINAVPTITSVTYVDGEFVANGFVTATIRGVTVTDEFQAPVGLNVISQGPGLCPILDLSLGALELDLLGLVVTTSPICLTLDAEEGGGLLGDLLCQIGGLLDGGLTLDMILAGDGLPLLGLPGLDVAALLSTLEDVLNQLLGNVFGGVFDVIPGSGRTCDILYLEVGPVYLELLGLIVNLDDCNGGPVTVEITGESGRGKLLGTLLCGLLEGLDGITLEDLLGALLTRLSQ